jgi:hypothetical protein
MFPHLNQPVVEPARGVIGRDVALEMAKFMLAHPGCNDEDLRREHFDTRQIKRYGKEASALANRLSVRRLA